MSVKLYPYQEAAKDKIVATHRTLLAMDCGTGKTGCSLIAMEELMEQRVIRHPVLVLTLATLKFQWQDEVMKFTESTVTVIDGTPVKRRALYAMFRIDPTDYLVVNYETFVRDYDFYREQKWGALIWDESSMLSS